MTTKTNKGGRQNQSALVSQRNAKKNPKGGGKGGKKGRKPVAPVKVSKDRNWGPIAMFVAVGLIAVVIIGYAFWQQRTDAQGTWEEEAAAIEGVVNYREDNPDMLTNQHVTGDQQYEVTPPVGGNHNGAWQNCQGDIYDQPIFEEHAVHSLEHGSVWITYNPELVDQSQIDELAGRVEGNEMMLLSPYPELDSPISLQAWGFQLKVDDAGDERIGDFIRATRVNASMEPGATCSQGVTSTSESDPSSLNLGDQMGG